jgi:hypothetical protein
MRAVGELRYYTESEAISLSGLAADAISLCIIEGVVKPINSQGIVEYVDNDVLLLKVISSMLKAKKTLAATQDLRRRFGLPEWSSKPVRQKFAEANAAHRVVEKLLFSKV